MVTASHNPKQDNGYKVYWSNGCQIIPPHDSGIATEIEANLVPWDISPALCDSSPLCRDPVAEGVLNLYFERLPAALCRSRAFPNDPLLHPPIKFAYTAMHGVGYRFVRSMFDAFGVGEKSAASLLFCSVATSAILVTNADCCLAPVVFWKQVEGL